MFLAQANFQIDYCMIDQWHTCELLKRGSQVPQQMAKRDLGSLKTTFTHQTFNFFFNLLFVSKKQNKKTTVLQHLTYQHKDKVSNRVDAHIREKPPQSNWCLRRFIPTDNSLCGSLMERPRQRESLNKMLLFQQTIYSLWTGLRKNGDQVQRKHK